MPGVIGLIGPLLASIGGGSAAAGAAALGSLAGTGVSLGETIAHGSPTAAPTPTAAPPAPQTTAPPAPLNPQALATVGANTQYSTMGGTSPDYLQTILQQLQGGSGASLTGGPG